MAVAHLQADHRRFTGGDQVLEVDEATIAAVIAELERRYPGLGPLLTDGASVAIDGELLPRGSIYERVDPSSAVHFIAPITGG